MSFSVQNINNTESENNIVYLTTVVEKSINNKGLVQGPIAPSQLATRQTSVTPSVESLKLITNIGNDNTVTGYIPMRSQNMSIEKTSLASSFKKKSVGCKRTKVSVKSFYCSSNNKSKSMLCS